ncbi:hypothetical protein FRACYDRAFT_241087 [Fragilariopsis cylindrus CCMP1102]|uniref:Roadblock/LAMTOR2 domain-containing protein n=1 Tax=Fragilariopsis cylindrus CCMP1102 TaxID=635003 RepID=A0A1E7F8P2_9STRA|nr:hypothetical protein FRACYDRAFT_241087 [Fragilariopsis cylindrus CCMP1102]|eukprot:OEU14540.1 hypothetical protein FRACYDRAFT_241087 [Fragilariopsis cylindrus CCMP1102]
MIEDNNNADADQSTKPTTSTSTSTATGATTATGGGANWSEVQDTVSRLASHKGVLAVSILNSEGDIVTQQITSAGTARAAAAASSQQNSSSDVSSSSSSSNNVLGNPKIINPKMKNANLYDHSLSGHAHQDNISFVRIRTQRDEILIAPKLGYTLIALHDPTISSL